MEMPAPAKSRGLLFWTAIVFGGSCALCSVFGLGVAALGLMGDESTTAASVGRPSGHLPTGETPDLFPGRPGWLPSGRGVSIPDARVSDDGPEGPWWYWQLQTGDKMAAFPVLFLADGTEASNPRPGGGLLFDIDGQRAQRGTTGVGTFSLSNGQITRVQDGVASTDSFEHGISADGPWFEIGKRRYSALAPPSG